MTLDIRTLFVAIVFAYLLFGVLQVASWGLRRGNRALLLLGVSNLCGGIASQLLAMRGMIPDALSIVLGNGVFLLCFSLMWAGLRQFAGQRIHWPVVWLAPLALMALYLGYAPVGENLQARICVFASVVTVFSLACFRDAWQAQTQEPLVMRRLAMATFLATALFMLFRIHATLSEATAAQGFMGPSSVQSLATLVSLLIVLVWNLAVHLMNSERLENRLRGMAHSDALTGVLNRAGFRRLALRQIERSRHDSRPVSLLLMDLDHFKRINDRHGHEAGDRLLCAFVESARQAIRPGDLLARHGGEEFCALLPGASPGEAMAVAQRIRSRFEAVRVAGRDGETGTTVSIGVAELGLQDESLEAGLERADCALYAAKDDGRNRVVWQPAAAG